MEMLKKILLWGAIAFLLFFVAFKPGNAVDVVRMLGDTAATLFQGIGDFFGNLVP